MIFNNLFIEWEQKHPVHQLKLIFRDRIALKDFEADYQSMGYGVTEGSLKSRGFLRFRVFQRFQIIKRFFTSYSFMNFHIKVPKEFVNTENPKNMILNSDKII